MDKDSVEKIVAAPAVVVEKAVATAEIIEEKTGLKKGLTKAKNYWRILGPGITTGAADDDPSGVATYSQTGARYGFQLAWLSLLCFPLMGTIQEMCARIGLVTGEGLAANIRRHYPRYVLYICVFLLIVANTLNIGADLGAMSKATQLLAPGWSFVAILVGFTALSLVLQIFLSYRIYSRYLKWLSFTLLAYVLVPFVTTGFPWREALLGLAKPALSLSKEQIILICGILGTTISPYLFFWQSSQEVEEGILSGEKSLSARQQSVTPGLIRNMRLDSWSGMFFSQLVMFFIIIACAATLNKSGLTNVTTAAQAAEALRPLAGKYAYLLFASGIISTGLLGVPVLAGSASYGLAEAMGWKEGLYRQLKQASAFYGVMIIAMLVGFLINFIGLDPIKALLYSAVANGLVAPVMLILIVAISSNSQIMRERASSGWAKIFGYLAVGLMTIAGVATIFAIFA